MDPIFFAKIILTKKIWTNIFFRPTNFFQGQKIYDHNYLFPTITFFAKTFFRGEKLPNFIVRNLFSLTNIFFSPQQFLNSHIIFWIWIWFWIWDLGFGIQNLGFRIWDLGFGIQDLGLELWDLDSFWPTDPFDQLDVACGTAL